MNIDGFIGGILLVFVGIPALIVVMAFVTAMIHSVMDSLDRLAGISPGSGEKYVETKVIEGSEFKT